MAYNFDEPVSISNGIKQEYVKIVKLTFADFKTGGQTTMKEILPADAMITGIRYWKRTAFSGGSVSAVTLNIVQANTGSSLVTSFDAHTPAAGAQGFVATNGGATIFSGPATIDIPLNFVGTATTGNPTAGEIYIVVSYVR